MRIIQISDTHIGREGELLYGMVDAGAHLKGIIAEVNSAKPAPDCVLITGDLAEPASETGYGYFASLIASIEAPVFLLPGNHDSPELMARFSDGSSPFPVRKEPYQYAIEDFDIRILMLNSHRDGSELPSFGDDRAAWLDEELKGSDRPTMIAIHHPPMRTDISWIDMAGRWYADLERVISRHLEVKLVICGHAHTIMTGRIAHAPVYVASSSAYQLISPRGEDIAPVSVSKPAPPALHVWDGEEFQISPKAWHVEATGERIDALSGLDWQVLKAMMRGEAGSAT